MTRPLGQHFLTDPAILDRIVAALDPTPADVVLEVGPGEGTLTRRLAPRVGRVVAIEKDRVLAERLRTGADGPLPENVIIVEGDALAIDWRVVAGVGGPADVGGDASVAPTAAESSARPPAGPPARRPFKIAGNIPYYITSPLIEMALRPPPPSVIVYLVQREVADRVAAQPGGKTYGALTVGVRVVARAERLFVVRAGAFHPPPNVDSAVLRLTPRPDPLIEEAERAAFRGFVVGLFGQRRKQMVGGLRVVTGLDREGALVRCAEVGIDPTARPETLSVTDFVRLFHAIPR
jgi:16S rRNA (adenine1518-N6/adenine1519-N6)-dimethyltransferase